MTRQEAADNTALAALVAVLAYNWRCNVDARPGNTISERTRAIVHTDTTAGRVIFTAAWGAFSFWLHHHIVNGGDQ